MFFYIDESTIHKGLYCLRLNGENENWKVTGRANFNILPARMLGFAYPDYLNYCENELGADIFGREYEVPYPMFRDNLATRDFVTFLNERTMATMKV